MRNGDTVEAAVDAQPRWKLGGAGDRRHAEMLAPRGRDRTHWRASVNAEEGRFAIDLCPEQEMILLRALQGQGLKYRILHRRLRLWPTRAEDRSGTEKSRERRDQTMADAAGAEGFSPARIARPPPPRKPLIQLTRRMDFDGIFLMRRVGMPRPDGEHDKEGNDIGKRHKPAVPHPPADRSRLRVEIGQRHSGR